MVLDDILELAESPEYSSHPKQQPGELLGFKVPEWMIEKMKVGRIHSRQKFASNVKNSFICLLPFMSFKS